MSSNTFPQVNPADAVIPGYFSLVLEITLRYSQHHIYLALASARDAVRMTPLQAFLTLDLEPLGGFSTCLFYRWSDEGYSSLKPRLVVPQKFPRQGKILIPPEISQHLFQAQFKTVLSTPSDWARAIGIHTLSSMVTFRTDQVLKSPHLGTEVFLN